MWLYLGLAVASLLLILSLLHRKLPAADQAVVRTKPFLVPAGLLATHHLKVFPTTTNVAHAVRIVSRRDIQRQVFENATLVVMRRHPLLRARFTELDGELYLEEMERLEPDVTQCHSGDWRSELEEQLLLPYQAYRGPLCWRTVFMSEEADTRYTDKVHSHHYSIVFGFHHSIMDGSTLLIFLKDYLSTLSDLARGRISVEEEVTSLPVPIPLDYLHSDLHEIRCCDTV